jgi:hypothetical protein
MATRSPSSPKGLDDLVKGGHIEARSPEPPQVLESRLRREEADAESRRNRENFLTRAAAIVVAVISAFSIVVVALPWTPPETSKWATSVLNTVITGAVVFVAGRGSKDPVFPG